MIPQMHLEHKMKLICLHYARAYFCFHYEPENVTIATALQLEAAGRRGSRFGLFLAF